jgi:ferredoxin
MMCKIEFTDRRFAPLELEVGQPLAEVLTIQNSPVLFGCRTGLCGTCIVAVTGDMTAATPAELELLELYGADDPAARLACQLDIRGDVMMAKL